MHASGLKNCFELETTDVSCTTNHQLAMLMRKAGNDCRRNEISRGKKEKQLTERSPKILQGASRYSAKNVFYIKMK